MIDQGKRNVLGVLVDAVDYDAAVQRIMYAAKRNRAYAVTALAVHGIMEGVNSREHRYRLNHFDMVTPDGQPVRWALNLLYRTRLPERVYGPELTLRVCAAAAHERIPVFFYGSRNEVLELLAKRLTERFPGLIVAGTEPSKFRRTTVEEKEEIARRIRDSGAGITFVGLGCPRQEVFTYEYRDLLKMPVIAVGAAFDYHAGLMDEPLQVLQRAGLQWFYRLMQEPRRLWRRYVLLNPAYLALFALQALRLRVNDPADADPPKNDVLFG